MGAVSSACEGCFGNEQKLKLPSNPNTHEEKAKYQEMKSEQLAKESNKNPAESAKNSGTVPIAGQNGGSGSRSSMKKKHEDTGMDKSKKMTIQDFELIKVNSNVSESKLFRFLEEDHLVKCSLFRKKLAKNFMPSRP